MYLKFFYESGRGEGKLGVFLVQVKVNTINNKKEYYCSEFGRSNYDLIKKNKLHYFLSNNCIITFDSSIE